MLQDAWSAAKLDVEFYNKVEADKTYTSKAAVLVVIVSILSAIGAAIAVPGSQGFFTIFIASVIGGLIGWVIWAALTNWIGTSFFGATSDTGEMLRVLGYAQAPLALGVIPFLGWVAAIWALVAGVVAAREGLDISTGKTIATLLVGWIIMIALRFFVGLVF